MTENPTPAPARVAAACLALQALILLGLVMLGAVLLLSPGTDKGSMGMWELLLLAMTGLLLLLARALRDGRAWARSGAVVWNLLLIPVGWQTLGPAWWYAGVLILVLAVVGLVAAFLMPPGRR